MEDRELHFEHMDFKVFVEKQLLIYKMLTGARWWCEVLLKLVITTVGSRCYQLMSNQEIETHTRYFKQGRIEYRESVTVVLEDRSEKKQGM